jgi:ER degradation enhancer, mannosidase alpha-like 2
MQYRATGDTSWLWAGVDFLKSIQAHCRTECGYASIRNVTTQTLDDDMPSFFLSETLKYLYLLFDEVSTV